MANHWDFLIAVDDFTRASPLGCVPGGHEMHQIARDAGLAEPNHQIAANWTGILVELDCLKPGAQVGDRPIPPGRMWSDIEVQQFADYRVTTEGRAEADRLRRQAREQRTDAALGRKLPSLTYPWMNEAQQRAIAEPLHALQTALDSGSHHGAAIGAAKDLVEAACKVVIEQSGQAVAGKPSLPTLFKQACETQVGGMPAADELGRSLTATVQRLAELRNAVGAGHGHASVPNLSAAEAYLAASAASSVATFLLSRRIYS